MPPDPSDALREEVERAYRACQEPLTTIAARHGITVADIGRMRAAHGWPARYPGGRKRTVGRRVRKGSKLLRRKGGHGAPLELLQRLYRTIDASLRRMELRMTSEELPSAADGERDSRSLGQLIRSVEKVTEIEADAERADGGEPAAAPQFRAIGPIGSSIGSPIGSPIGPADADRLRLELAQRILRLADRHKS